jgi:hypothetical protein
MLLPLTNDLLARFWKIFPISGRIAAIRDNTPFLSFDPDIFQWKGDNNLWNWS